jgi:hypothetical protein
MSSKLPQLPPDGPVRAKPSAPPPRVRSLPELKDKAAIVGIKLTMGYEDGTRRCSKCSFFGPCELMSGATGARPARCERNALWFPVSETGHCNEFVLAVDH